VIFAGWGVWEMMNLQPADFNLRFCRCTAQNAVMFVSFCVSKRTIVRLRNLLKKSGTAIVRFPILFCSAVVVAS